jgi:hypothetical protein
LETMGFALYSRLAMIGRSPLCLVSTLAEVIPISFGAEVWMSTNID